MPDTTCLLYTSKQELTYNELYKSIENLWSILFTTGYLTQRERIDSRKLRLAIPNREIKELFELQIREWFQEKSSEDVKKLDKLCMAFPDGDAETIEDLFNDYLWNTISIRDTAVKGRKENFYHGVLLGLLSHKMCIRDRRNDINYAIPLLDQIEINGSNVLADRGYDSNKLLDYVYARGGEPTIPSRKGAKFERHCDWWLYKERHLVEKSVSYTHLDVYKRQW